MLTLVSQQQQENIRQKQEWARIKQEREIAILNCLDEGKHYEEIARHLCLSLGTTRRLISELITANNCRNSRELLNLARQSNFFNDQKQEA